MNSARSLAEDLGSLKETKPCWMNLSVCSVQGMMLSRRARDETSPNCERTLVNLSRVTSGLTYLIRKFCWVEVYWRTCSVFFMITRFFLLRNLLQLILYSFPSCSMVSPLSFSMACLDSEMLPRLILAV